MYSSLCRLVKRSLVFRSGDYRGKKKEHDCSFENIAECPPLFLVGSNVMMKF